MKLLLALWTSVLLAVLLPATEVRAGDAPAPASLKLRVLLFTGGHPFEHAPFFKLFQDNSDITYQAAEPPRAYSLLRPEAASNFDVLVFYTYNRTIGAQAKADLLAWLDAGKGLVVLHHAIAAYPDWPEYWNIIGARYYLRTNIVVDGVIKARSAYKEGLHFRVHIADPSHPVTCGLSDYEFHDEVYRLYDFLPGCHPLLTVDEPRSNPVIAWARAYHGARVVYIQSGHDHFAYENPNYQKVLRQAIRWTGWRD